MSAENCHYDIISAAMVKRPVTSIVSMLNPEFCRRVLHLLGCGADDQTVFRRVIEFTDAIVFVITGLE